MQPSWWRWAIWLRSQLTEFGGEIFPCEQQTPQALAAMQRADAEKWWPIIKAFGIKAG
jgi:hypothetical protein